MIYDLVDSKNEQLHEKTELFDFANPVIDPIDLFNNMRDSIIKYKGLGLSNNQCVVPFKPVSMFVIGNYSDPESIYPFFNPKIVDSYGEKVYMDEGCLSYPDLIIKIKRFEKVRVRFTNQFGDTNTANFEGLTARVIQHEFDHLNGVVFTDIANRYHLDKANKYRDKLIKFKKNKKVIDG